MYKSLTDELLFDYYMIDCKRKDSIFSPSPFYMDKNLFHNMKALAEVLDNLINRIIEGINNDFHDFKEFIPHFNYKQNILHLNLPLPPTFWVRFDAFIKDDGGIFFSEFNYDKPCAQRELLVSEYLEAKNNVNIGFKENFIQAFKAIVKNFFNCNRRFTIAVLMDPCHWEEVHLANLYKDIMEDEYFTFIPVGPNNLKVLNGELIAFSKEKVDVVLRQFPTEHLDEISNIEEILTLYEKRKILMLNDPRVIIGQCKGLFAYLWHLVKKDDCRISKKEKNIIESTIPYSELFNINQKEYVLKNKDKFVLKPIYGRYSEDVFIGVLHNNDEWASSVDYVINSKKDFLLQEFCPIHKDSVTAVSKYRYIPKKAFGNFGVYLINGKVKGVCTRWNESYLTCDESTWITPIGTSENFIKVLPINVENHKDIWDKILDRALMEYNFTGRYARDKEYIGIESLLLNREKFYELKEACSKICSIFRKTQNVVMKNIDMFSSILGINGLNSLASQNFTDSLMFLGRMDWCLNTKGEWKLLELNSETPAGLVESIGISKIIKEELNIKYENPNENMSEMIKKHFTKIINDYKNVIDIKNVGILSSTYYEDWYNTSILKDLLEDIPYNIILGNIYDATIKNEKVNIYNTPLDVIFRYYPLDWFLKENKIDLLKCMEKNTLSINPPHTIISQSKAFFALIFEFKKQGFFSKEECSTINKYLVETSFEADSLCTCDICIKPLLEREGTGVLLGHEIFKEPDYDFIFQKREDITPIDYIQHSTICNEKKIMYPIIGTYIVDDTFCGIYTRLGDIITTNSCIYAPVFLTD